MLKLPLKTTWLSKSGCHKNVFLKRFHVDKTDEEFFYYTQNLYTYIIFDFYVLCVCVSNCVTSRDENEERMMMMKQQQQQKIE
jgi:hypothetical protein